MAQEQPLYKRKSGDEEQKMSGRRDSWKINQDQNSNAVDQAANLLPI